jgi:hypothetical protein
VLVLGDGGGWVYRVQEATQQPVVRSPIVVGTRGGGGGSPEKMRWCHAIEMALEALNLSTIYVRVYVGEW